MPIRQRLEIDAHGVVRQDAICELFGTDGSFAGDNDVTFVSQGGPEVYRDEYEDKLILYVGGWERPSGRWVEGPLTDDELERVLKAVEEFNRVFDRDGQSETLGAHTVVAAKQPYTLVTDKGEELVYFQNRPAIMRDKIVTCLAELAWKDGILLNCNVINPVTPDTRRMIYINCTGNVSGYNCMVMRRPVVLPINSTKGIVYDEDTGKAVVVTPRGVSYVTKLDVALKCAVLDNWASVYLPRSH
jgi:hypothetical protein